MRSSCAFCGGAGRIEHSATSRFFAKRTSDADPWPLPIFSCARCGSRQFSQPVPEERLGRLYDDYRSDDYFRERNAFEPWYTRKVHDSLSGEQDFIGRRRVLLDVLGRCGVENEFDCILDHGGDRGQMISPAGGLNTKQRFVFDVSGVPPEDGVRGVSSDGLQNIEWDLILSCHVLEHVLSPESYLAHLRSLGRSGTWFFLELPFEPYRASRLVGSPLQERWLEWLCKTSLPFMLADFISTACRVKLRYLPPFCFHPLREHLQFFTVEGLKEFLSRSGFEVRLCEIGACGHITALARKA